MTKKIFKGSTKTLYQSDDDYSLILSFDDNIRIGDDDLAEISGKGVVNNSISSYIMQKLKMIGIDNHFIKKNNMRQQLVQFVDVYPIQIHVSTIASGRYVKDFDMEEGFVFDSPLIDFRVKNRDLGYPIVNESQMDDFGWLTKDELVDMKDKAIRIHDFLSGLFAGIKIRMVDIKLEFGRVFDEDGYSTILVDEISPDTCRLWDMETNEKLSFEIAEKGLDKIMPAYQEILRRLES